MARKSMVHGSCASFLRKHRIRRSASRRQKQLIGRVVEATLYDITGDFSHMYLKMFFQISEIDGKTARHFSKVTSTHAIICEA